MSGAVFAVLNALRPDRKAKGSRHRLQGRHVLALLLVADRCGSLNGNCTASLPVLAATAGVGRATMQRAIAGLVKSGWLKRERRHRDLTDVLRIGPTLKRYQTETSQSETSKPETSQDGRKRSHGDTAERSHSETQSTPRSAPQALRLSGSGSGTLVPGKRDVVPGGWPAKLSLVWREFGEMAHGRLGKALGGLVKTHGPERTEAGLRRWLEAGNARFGPECFARDAVSWINGDGPPEVTRGLSKAERLDRQVAGLVRAAREADGAALARKEDL